MRACNTVKKGAAVTFAGRRHSRAAHGRPWTSPWTGGVWRSDARGSENRANTWRTRDLSLAAMLAASLFTPVDNIVDTFAGRRKCLWGGALRRFAREKLVNLVCGRGRTIGSSRGSGANARSHRKPLRHAREIVSTCTSLLLWICA